MYQPAWCFPISVFPAPIWEDDPRRWRVRKVWWIAWGGLELRLSLDYGIYKYIYIHIYIISIRSRSNMVLSKHMAPIQVYGKFHGDQAERDHESNPSLSHWRDLAPQMAIVISMVPQTAQRGWSRMIDQVLLKITLSPNLLGRTQKETISTSQTANAMFMGPFGEMMLFLWWFHENSQLYPGWWRWRISLGWVPDGSRMGGWTSAAVRIVKVYSDRSSEFYLQS